MAKSKRIRILYMEDDPGLARLVQKKLERAGYAVDLARDGEEGLSMYAAGGYDVVAVDQTMPVYDGLEVIRILASQGSLPPTIMITGTGDEKIAVEAIKLGAGDYIVKDVDGGYLDLLPTVIKHVLQQQRLAEEKQRAEEALRQRNRELALLNRANQALTSTLNLEQVLDIVLEEVRRLLKAVGCSVWLIDPATGELVCQQANGPKSETMRGWRLAPGEGIAGWVVGNGGSLIVPDALSDERHFKEVDQQTGLALRSILGIPLRVKEDVIGVLEVVDTEADRFKSADLALAESLAVPAAAAIENARLYEMAQQELAERERAEEERERLLAQIQEQAQQVQQIVDTVPEGVLLLDAGGQVVLANPVAEGGLSVLAGASVGDTLTRLGDRPLAELLTSPPKGLWHEAATDGPSPRVFEVIARPIETGPTHGGWVLVIRDVTQEREIERRAQQQERLAAVGQLAAGIAHDFNNIMATIILYAQMGSRAEDLPARVRERMVTINQQAQHATRLIQQILDLSRRAVLERQPLDLLLLLKEHVRLLERTLPESIEVELVYGRDEYVVNADPTRVQQAITNLAVNARDAMPQGGNLHIGLERIAVRPGESPPLPEMEAGKWVQLTVSDTGTGISPAVLPHIFDPFFTTKAPDRGTGLGLAQVHGIVTQHEGHIDVESQVGQGATFTIYLPALLVHPVEATTLEMVPLAKGQGETILLVEDDEATRKAVLESLTLLNYKVLAAADGKEALEILERHGDDPSTGPSAALRAGSGQGIALILSDVVMPKMGGIALLHALRQQGWEVGVVMLTGHPMEKELEALRAQGLTDWLPKPPSLESLAKVMARALTKTRPENSRR